VTDLNPSGLPVVRRQQPAEHVVEDLRDLAAEAGEGARLVVRLPGVS
jgi:hypothetical protein